MTNHHLDARAGSESYLETVAPELRRLGHEVLFFSAHCGGMAGQLRDQAFTVLESPDDLPDDVDVIHGQHADAIALVRGRLPRTPLVFVTHSWFIPLEDPLTELGASAFVAFNELTRRRLATHAATVGSDVVRLTQPVRVSYADGQRVLPAPVARRAVTISRALRTLPDRLGRACDELGIEFDWVGGPGRVSTDARREMRTADIVVGVGRTALEGMAESRAVLVADENVVAGWVTPDSWPELEADGFTGRTEGAGGLDLVECLAAYSQELGAAGRRLAVRHHNVQEHASQLVELYQQVAERPVHVVPPSTLAQLVGDRHALEWRAVGAEWQVVEERRALDEATQEAAVLRAALDDVTARLAATRDRVAAVEGQRDRARAKRDLFRDQRDRLREQLSRRAAVRWPWRKR